ncbi:hypothetical protein [Paenibacillus medicaginis]|uniref:DNA-binding protein n=1 Tax=Paenibacillus medicaginis TaxID=1470560 RepID=A0ABV5C104_9BACL
MDDLHLDDLRIDSLVDLLKASYTLEDYEHMIEIADKLLLSAERVYSRQKQSIDSGKRYVYLDGKRHIVYYFGFSQMAKGIALQKKELYNESLICIKNYADLSWLDDGSKDAAEEIAAFKTFAEANTYSVNLLAGRQEYLHQYVQFLKASRIEELLPGMITILNSAIQHGFAVDFVLNDSEGAIEEAIEACSKDSKEVVYVTKFYYTLSEYHLKMKHYQIALHYILLTLAVSDKFKNVAVFKKCVVLFEHHRIHADQDQQNTYAKFMNEIWEREIKNEKSISNDDAYNRVN